MAISISNANSNISDGTLSYTISFTGRTGDYAACQIIVNGTTIGSATTTGTSVSVSYTAANLYTAAEGSSLTGAVTFRVNDMTNEGGLLGSSSRTGGTITISATSPVKLSTLSWSSTANPYNLNSPTAFYASWTRLHTAFRCRLKIYVNGTLVINRHSYNLSFNYTPTGSEVTSMITAMGGVSPRELKYEFIPQFNANTVVDLASTGSPLTRATGITLTGGEPPPPSSGGTHPVINSLKYQKVRIKNGATWQSPKEVWVKDGITWKEPKQIWLNKAGTWTKATTKVNWVAGSTTFFAVHGTAITADMNKFNNYVDTGNTYATYTFEVILTTTGVQQTLFSYGNSGSTSFYEIYISSANQVVSRSWFNSTPTTIPVITHGTALSADTYYKITVQHKSNTGTTYRTVIQVRDITGAVVGTDILSTATVASYSSSAVQKFIGKRWTNTNYFRGILLNVTLYGGQTTSTIKNTFNAGSFLSSTTGSTTMNDTETASGTENFTITGSVISSTE